MILLLLFAASNLKDCVRLLGTSVAMFLGATCSCRLEPEAPNLSTNIVSFILRAYDLRFHKYQVPSFPSSPSTNTKLLECLRLLPEEVPDAPA